MKTRTTIGISTLFLMVSAAYILTFTNAPKQEKILQEGSSKLLPVDDTNQIRWLQIQRPEKKETITFVKANDSWQMKYPVIYPADDRMVRGILGVLSIARKARQMIPEGPWENYHLRSPVLKIGIETDSPGRKYLYLGDESPVSDFYYGRWEGESELFLIENHIRQALDRSVYSLREKRIFRFPLNESMKLKVRTPGGIKGEWMRKGEDWFYTEPVEKIGQKVPQDLLRQTFDGLRDFYVKKFLDQDAGKDSDFGFSIKSAFIELKDGSGKRYSLTLGQRSLDREIYYGRIEGENIPFEISALNLDAFFSLFDTSLAGSQKS